MFLLLQYYIYGVFSASKRSSTSFWGFFFLGSGGGYNRWKCVLSTPLLRKSASWEKNLADICGYGGTVTCSGWRAPRTSTTISWCDGELGPLFVTFGEGQLRDCEVDEINSLYEGTLHVEHSCKKTHMWNGEVCIKFLDFVAKEIRRKRLSLGYTDASQCPCLAICDRAPSHQSQVFQDMRARWAKEHNVVLLGADNEGPCTVPGGYGATMQPNDRRVFWKMHFYQGDTKDRKDTILTLYQLQTK